MKSIRSCVTFGSLLAALCLPAAAQEFEINGGKTQPQVRPQGQQPAQGGGGGLGWGSSIEVARASRAAEDALRRGNYSAAANFAERALKSAPQNTRLWFLLGYAARLSGQYQRSVAAFQRGLQHQPGSIEGLSGLAQTYARMGRSDEAKKLLLQIIRANPSRHNDLLIAGELMIQTGEYGQAIPLLQKAHALKSSARPALLLAMAYMRQKQTDKARQWLERARSHGVTAELLRAMAGFHREARQYDEAIAALRQIKSKSADVLGELAYTYELAGKRKEAAQAYAQAADAAPKQINLQLAAAQAHARVADDEAAHKFLKRAEALDPGHYRLHAIRADMARTDNRLQEAAREYEVALRNLPESVPEGVLYPIQLRYNLSDVYRERNDEAAAREQVRRAAAAIAPLNLEGPQRPEFLRLRAAIRIAEDDLKAAERDLKEALALDRDNPNILLPYGNLQWKMGDKDEAHKAFIAVLKAEPNNRFALSSLGYLARDVGKSKEAEQYFLRLTQAHPKDHAGYLALGDLYTAIRVFDKAQANYAKAWELNQTNPLIVAGGANAGIEGHQLDLSEQWLNRAQAAMKDHPRVMLETERWLTWKGRYRESAAMGYKVIKLLPNHRDASVYLGYSLYNLGRYDEVLQLVNRYEQILPREANFPLLAGYVHKQTELLHEAADDFTRALAKDPKMVEAWVNRGYVFNDTQNAEQAARDFETALKLAPKNGVAHLGIAFSYLELKKPKRAREHVDKAAELLGESGSTHLARAGAFRQQQLLREAEREYRLALKVMPDDLQLHLALADTLFHMRRYGDSVAALTDALRLAPDDPFLYAQVAHNYARMGRRDDTLRYVGLAEQEGADYSQVLLSTGDALLQLGDEEAAMERFERALVAPDANRVDARLAIANLFVRRGQWDDGRQQIALAFAESRIGEASPVTTDNLLQAAGLFLSMREFDLAERYYERAQQAGAAEQVVAIGLANAYLAQGDTPRAEAQLALLGAEDGAAQNYDYLLAMGQVYRQRHDNVRALSAFARANMLAGPDDAAQRNLLEVAGAEGLRLNEKVSVSTDFSVTPIFEDPTIYMMDNALVAHPGVAIVPPRSSLETRSTAGFKVHQQGLPDITGFVQLRNARGQVSFPSEDVILDRNTYDWSFSGALNPVLRMGRNTFTFSGGLQFTLRRDKAVPRELNQNLFRQFVYVQSNALWNWLTIRGHAMHEAGPFTNRDLKSSDISGRLEFVVGRPWGKTALLSGYFVRDVKFEPLVREYFSTSAYVGLQRRFGEKFKLTGLAEYVRAWRIQDDAYSLAQALRPVARFEITPNHRWNIEGTVALARGMGSHTYDNIQGGFLISYVKPLRRMLHDGAGEIPVDYPLRFSIGLQQESYLNLAGRSRSTVRPIVRLTLF